MRKHCLVVSQRNSLEQLSQLKSRLTTGVCFFINVVNGAKDEKAGVPKYQREGSDRVGTVSSSHISHHNVVLARANSGGKLV